MTIHKDLCDQEINIDDIVVYGSAFGSSRSIFIGKVVRLTDKMIIVDSNRSINRLYAKDTVKVEPELYTLFLLKK